MGGTDQPHYTFKEDSHSYKMAFVRKPFEFTMVYNDILANRKVGRSVVKCLILTMKEHDEHRNCYTKQQNSLPEDNNMNWMKNALEAGRHTLVLFTCSEDFLDEEYFLYNIHTSHAITSKRTESESKVIPIVYNMSPAMVEGIKVEKWMYCTGDANL